MPRPPHHHATPSMRAAAHVAASQWTAQPASQAPAAGERQPSPATLPGDHCPRKARTSRAVTCGDARSRGIFSEIAGMLDFVTDAENLWAVANCYKDQVAPGSLLGDLPRHHRATSRSGRFTAG
jgi:hypothetical protein